MSLDFAVLDQSEAPEKTVALRGELHYELVTLASGSKLAAFAQFEDYYADVEVAFDELPDLQTEARLLRFQTNSLELQHFLDQLCDLIAYAIAEKRALHAIAD